MPISVIATPGAEDANAYSTVEEAAEYASYRVGGAAFMALTDDQKVQALVTAASDINTLETIPGFVGSRYSDEQSLAWPRDSANLPANLVAANIELAMYYASAFSTGSDVLNRDTANGNVKRKRIGPLETEWFAPNSASATAFERLPPVVQRLLYDLVLHVPSAWGSAEVRRGS